MTCEHASAELVECARVGVAALPDDEALAAHVAGCEGCRARWESERELTAHLRAMRLTSVPASINGAKRF